MNESEGKQEPMIKESVEWVAEAAQKVADFQIDCANALERQATTLLNLSVAGASGALAFAVKLSELTDSAWQQGGMWAASIWLFIVAAILLKQALWCRPISGSANDPKNLISAYRMSKEEILYFDLKQRQQAIELNRVRNNSVGFALNLCRGLAIATPLAFGFGAAIATA